MSIRPPKKTIALGTATCSIPQLLANVIHYVTSMTGNTYFPAPTPSLAQITAQADLLKEEYEVSLTRAKGAVSSMRAEEKQLVILLKLLAAYVEAVANADPERASEIIASAGMPERKPPERVSRQFRAFPGPLKGSVTIETIAVRYSAYIFQMTSDPRQATGWITIYTGTRVKYTHTGLTSAAYYYFRMAVSTKGEQGDWSNVLQVLVQ